jgi:hypothetical protein
MRISFDLDDTPAEEVKQSFDGWAQHLLVGRYRAPAHREVEALEDLVSAFAHEALDSLDVRLNLQDIAILKLERAVLEVGQA